MLSISGADSHVFMVTASYDIHLSDDLKKGLQRLGGKFMGVNPHGTCTCCFSNGELDDVCIFFNNNKVPFRTMIGKPTLSHHNEECFQITGHLISNIADWLRVFILKEVVLESNQRAFLVKNKHYVCLVNYLDEIKHPYIDNYKKSCELELVVAKLRMEIRKQDELIQELKLEIRSKTEKQNARK
jgi:hypothetical protein